MSNKVYMVPNPPTPNKAVEFDPEICNGCNLCVDICRSDVMMPNPEKKKPPIVLYPDECWFCGCCVEECNHPGAIKMLHPLNQSIVVSWKRKDTKLEGRERSGSKMNIARPSSPWVGYHVPDKAYNGYTLFTPKGGSVAWLIDMEGRCVHCWEMPYRAGEYGVLLPSGNLLYGGHVIPRPDKLGGFGGVLLEVDWDGNIVWKYEDIYLHHDFCRMDNGNTMILRLVRIPDEIAAKVRGGLPGTGQEGVMWTDSFQEITPAGEVVWEWLGYEHLDPEVDVICPLCPRGEWTHGNACFVLPNGDILTSFRRTDTIAIIDKSTGNIRWRWGPGELAHQHNPTLLDNGNILVFDNGAHRRRRLSGNTKQTRHIVSMHPPSLVASGYLMGIPLSVRE